MPRPGQVEEIAIKAWNLMDGEVDWAAMPFIAEYLGCDDLDGLVAGLRFIRQHTRERDHGRRSPDD